MSVPIPVAAMKEPEQRLEAWVRVVPYVLLAISMVPYLITESPTAADVGRTLAVAGLTAAWVAWWVTLHPQWADRRVLMGIYFVGFAACCAARTSTRAGARAGPGTTQRARAGRARADRPRLFQP
jgi:hypothetical protein